MIKQIYSIKLVTRGTYNSNKCTIYSWKLGEIVEIVEYKVAQIDGLIVYYAIRSFPRVENEAAALPCFSDWHNFISPLTHTTLQCNGMAASPHHLIQNFPIGFSYSFSSSLKSIYVHI